MRGGPALGEVVSPGECVFFGGGLIGKEGEGGILTVEEQPLMNHNPTNSTAPLLMVVIMQRVFRPSKMTVPLPLIRTSLEMASVDVTS